ENWGTANGGATLGDGGISSVGWTAVAIAQTGGPHVGLYPPTGAAPPGHRENLPPHTPAFYGLLSNHTTHRLLYTTDTSGAGAGGKSSFTDINPTQYTNLTLSAEERNGGGAAGTNYFAVRVGGAWYVATSYIMPDSGALTFPNFTNATLIYTNPA